MAIYDKRNVYILGADDRNLIEFIKGPQYEWNKEIKNRYTFEAWINRFFDNKCDIEGL